MTAECSGLLFLFSALLLLLFSSARNVSAQPPRPAFSVGSITVPQRDLSKHTNNAAEWCAASAVADLPSRLALPQWDADAWTPKTFEDKRQGPYMSLYPRVDWASQVPAGCDTLHWAQQRLLAGVNVIIQMGLSYCHFRVPTYAAPPEIRAVCLPLELQQQQQQLTASPRSMLSASDRPDGSSASSSNSDDAGSTVVLAAGSQLESANVTAPSSKFEQVGLNPPTLASDVADNNSNSSSISSGCVWVPTSICNSELEGFRRAVHPWRGLDCQNFVAVVYNMFFGYYATTSLSEAACHPTYAPGRLLHTITAANLDQLQPGDLLFGRQSRCPQDGQPAAVRHVALFTGYAVDFDNSSSPWYNATLLNNIPQAHWPAYVRCMAHQRQLGRPVWVVADSNFFGPGYRPLCGPYINNFSHARRILMPAGDVGPLTNLASIATWDAASKTCLSKWALLESHYHHHISNTSASSIGSSNKSAHSGHAPSQSAPHQPVDSTDGHQRLRGFGGTIRQHAEHVRYSHQQHQQQQPGAGDDVHRE